MSPGQRTIPSLTRKPAARSRSSPGVRIVIVSACPATLMPSGSSAASRSERSLARGASGGSDSRIRRSRRRAVLPLMSCLPARVVIAQVRLCRPDAPRRGWRVNVVDFAFVQHYGLMAEASPGRGSYHRRHRRTSYHHGDLANALADAATEMARAGGPHAVVLRAAARAVGAAAMQLSLDEGEPLAHPAEESLRRLRALGRAYIRFALDDPGLFRTAFCRPDKPLPDASARMASRGPYVLLSEVLDELVEHGVLDPARRTGAEIPAWAAVHGLATLLIDGPLALITGEERVTAIERSSDCLLNGIRGPP